MCLGHQSIGQAFGATVARARVQMHGKTSQISHDGRGVFTGLSNPFVATRYHSLVVLPGDRAARPRGLGPVGGQHRDGVSGTGAFPSRACSSTPESILTVEGKRLLANFLGAPTPAAVGS